LIGGAITSVMWMFYAARMAFGVGPMHDYQGNQAPALHYLVGALVVTGAIAIWIVARRPDT
jgi:hypothetical protein